MKKVKFTLSLALSFLFLGAGLNSAYGQFPDEEFPIYVLPYAPDIQSYTIETKYGSILKPNTISTWSSLSTITVHDYDDYLPIKVQTLSKKVFNEYNSKTQITVAFTYTGGKEKIASLSLKFLASDTEDNLFGGLELADEVTKKGEFFPSGTGTAKYTYEIDLNKLFDKYPKITAIFFEVWLKDEIVRDPDNANGEGNGYVQVLRPYTLILAEGITATIPINGYTPSGKNLKFEVNGEADKDLLVSTNRPLALGAPKYEKKRPGVYEITIPAVKSAIDITIGYAPTTESGDANGNPVITGDAVWGAAGAIYVNAATPSVVSVYNITGQLVKQEAVSGSKTLALPKGIYIVKLNGKATKVLL
jgi:hypothetical protein